VSYTLWQGSVLHSASYLGILVSDLIPEIAVVNEVCHDSSILPYAETVASDRPRSLDSSFTGISTPENCLNQASSDDTTKNQTRTIGANVIHFQQPT
jgi:hypothetical protein